jgi:hypothetical protein
LGFYMELGISVITFRPLSKRGSTQAASGDRSNASRRYLQAQSTDPEHGERKQIRRVP